MIGPTQKWLTISGVCTRCFWSFKIEAVTTVVPLRKIWVCYGVLKCHKIKAFSVVFSCETHNVSYRTVNNTDGCVLRILRFTWINLENGRSSFWYKQLGHMNTMENEIEITGTEIWKVFSCFFFSFLEFYKFPTFWKKYCYHTAWIESSLNSSTHV